MKKSIGTLILLLMLIGATACSNSEKNSQTMTDVTPASAITTDSTDASTELPSGTQNPETSATPSATSSELIPDEQNPETSATASATLSEVIPDEQNPETSATPSATSSEVTPDEQNPEMSACSSDTPSEIPAEESVAIGVKKHNSYDIIPYNKSFNDGDAILSYEIQKTSEKEEYDKLTIYIGDRLALHLWSEETEYNRHSIHCESDIFPELVPLLSGTYVPFTPIGTGRISDLSQQENGCSFSVNDFDFILESFSVKDYEQVLDDEQDSNDKYESFDEYVSLYISKKGDNPKFSITLFSGGSFEYSYIDYPDIDRWVSVVYETTETPEGPVKYLAKEGYRDENKDMVTAYYDNGEVKYVYDWGGVTSKEEFWIEHYDRDGKYVGKINQYENHLIDRDGNELLRKEESSYEDDEYWVDLYFADQLISHSCAGENLSYNVMRKDLIAYFEQEIKEQLDSIISDGWGRCDVEIDGKEYEFNGIWPYAYPYAVFCYDEWDNSVHVEVYNEQFTYLHKNGIIMNPDGNTNANGFTFSVPIDRLTGSQTK